MATSEKNVELPVQLVGRFTEETPHTHQRTLFSNNCAALTESEELLSSEFYKSHEHPGSFNFKVLPVYGYSPLLYRKKYVNLEEISTY